MAGGQHRRGLPIAHVQLDALAAAEVIHERPKGHVDRPVRSARSSAQSPPPKATARSDAVLRQLQRKMPPAAADLLGRFGQRHVAWCTTAAAGCLPERGPGARSAHGLWRERTERHFGVDPQFGHAVAPGRNLGRGVLAEGGAEGVERSPLRSSARPPPRDRRGRPGARRRRKGRVQVEARTLRAEPTPGFTPTASSDTKHHDRPMVLLGQAPGHDADHARVPAAIGQHQRRVVSGSNCSLACLLAAR